MVLPMCTWAEPNTRMLLCMHVCMYELYGCTVCMYTCFASHESYLVLALSTECSWREKKSKFLYVSCNYALNQIYKQLYGEKFPGVYNFLKKYNLSLKFLPSSRMPFRKKLFNFKSSWESLFIVDMDIILPEFVWS